MLNLFYCVAFRFATGQHRFNMNIKLRLIIIFFAEMMNNDFIFSPAIVTKPFLFAFLLQQKHLCYNEQMHNISKKSYLLKKGEGHCIALCS